MIEFLFEKNFFLILKIEKAISQSLVYVFITKKYLSIFEQINKSDYKLLTISK